MKCILCATHQVPLVELQLRLARCVLQVTTATREAELSQVASVQKAITVLRDRALTDHNYISAQWDIIVRRSAIQYKSLSYCHSWLLNIAWGASACILRCGSYSVMTSVLQVNCLRLLPALCPSPLSLLHHDYS